MALFLDRTGDRAGGRLVDTNGRAFDARRRTWSDPGTASGRPEEASPVSPRAAVAWLQADRSRACPVPVGVVGPREATAAQCDTAEALGRALGEIGIPVLCGGRQGVMTAVSSGAAAVGGTVIGLLPDDEPDAANDHVSLVLATGIGVARNAVIARAAFALIAVGGGYGTMSECAFALQFGRPVFGLQNAPSIDGIAHVDAVDDAIEGVCRVFLG